MSDETTTTVQIKGHPVLLDADFAADIDPALWCLCRSRGTIYFIVTHQRKKVRRVMLLHRIIMNAPRGMTVDHINGNTLDNRRSNLRICTNQENAMNRRLSKNSQSGRKGVRFMKHSPYRPWQARIRAEGKSLYLGSFATREEASDAYDQAALKYHGQFAHLNAGGASRHEVGINVPNLEGVM